MRILLGITGGIAAYKAANLIRGFSELGHDVTVLPTENALRFRIDMNAPCQLKDR